MLAECFLLADRFSGSRLGLTDESISCFKYSCVFAQMHRSSYKQLQYSRVDLRNSCVFAAMHRSPYQPQSDEVTFLYSGVQAAMHSDPYKHQAGDYKLLSDTILQQALGDDLFDSFFYDEALHNGDAMPWCDPEVHLSELTQADLDATMHASAASVTTTAAPAAIPEAQTGGKTTAAAPGISLTAIPAPLVRRLSEPLDEELPPPQLLENILPANGPVTKDDIAPTVDLVSDCSHPSNPHQTSTAVFASASLGAETPYMPRNMADTAESLFSATSQMIDAYDTLSTADFIASPLYAAVNRLALAQNIAIMAEFDRICSNIHHVAAPTLQAKPTLQKRLSAKFSTAKVGDVLEVMMLVLYMFHLFQLKVDRTNILKMRLCTPLMRVCLISECSKRCIVCLLCPTT